MTNSIALHSLYIEFECSNIETVQATDKDTGANAAIAYAIVGSQNYFDIDRTTGEIRSKSTFAQVSWREISFSVNATDNSGQGNSVLQPLQLKVKGRPPLEYHNWDICFVQISLLNVNERAILKANIPAATFKVNENAILSNISQLLGLNVSAVKIEKSGFGYRQQYTGRRF